MVRDLTKGKPLRLLLGFCAPLLIGNLFQQFYNMVDSIIVGKFIGKDALAAVGSTGSLNFLIIGFVLGMCSGFCIPVAQYFGEGDEARVRGCVANAVYLSAAITVMLTAATMLGTRPLLELMQTPENIIDDAYAYIVVIFAGIFATVLYNLLAGILRALGDSRTPLYFLILSSVLNVGMDLLFILYFNAGVAGAAYATVIAQLVSGVCCLVYMIKRYPILRMKKENLRPNRHLTGRLLYIGLPMAGQFSITGRRLYHYPERGQFARLRCGRCGHGRRQGADYAVSADGNDGDYYGDLLRTELRCRRSWPHPGGDAQKPAGGAALFGDRFFHRGICRTIYCAVVSRCPGNRNPRLCAAVPVCERTVLSGAWNTVCNTQFSSGAGVQRAGDGSRAV